MTANSRTATLTDPDDRRNAELAARTGLEPELAQRYAADPAAVLAEFGLSATEPLYIGGSFDSDDFVIEDLDPKSLSNTVALLTYCAS
ncbi:hypothetical protein [Streptacidiphilus cavernicola]|uniref:Alkylhydroperoxidase n=1 Tax=Streptacidiphilus cavernicola TaxID=3342716 RepID=A0ABV6VR01_9ACTN